MEGKLARPNATASISELAASVTSQLTPMLRVNDMSATLAFYTSIGFTLVAKNECDGIIDWAKLSLGKSELMVTLGGSAQSVPVSLWFGTARLEELFAVLKDRQLRRAQGELAGVPPTEPEVCFAEELYTAFYGTKQFSIKDPNGVHLVFCQS